MKVGALFAGYGGIELGLASVLDAEPAWFSEIEAAPSKILAHRYPDVPNLGDVTKIDWAAVESVDVITGGSPCQDLSHAGKRAGMRPGTRSGLWASMCDAIDIIRPSLVIWENVRGALSAEADSAVEPCPICVGDGGRVTLRALGRVLGDLSELGFDARWYGLRAADVGAAHGRFRIFLFAQPADADLTGLEGLADQAGAAPAGRHGHAEPGAVGPALTLLPTPVSDNSRGLPQKGTDFQSLPNVAVSLLPTPTSSDAKASGAYGYGGNEFRTLTDATVRRGQDWREYEAAIRRQEHAFGRPAPLPTEPGVKGQPRLSPRFVEWLMALPDGWVTDVPGISRNDMLKALGNGVCPPQCAAALRAFLHDTAKERAA